MINFSSLQWPKIFINKNSRMKLLILLHCFQSLRQFKILKFYVHKLASSFQSPASVVQRPASRVQGPGSRVQSSEFRVQTPASSIQSPAWNWDLFYRKYERGIQESNVTSLMFLCWHGGMPPRYSNITGQFEFKLTT